MRVIECGHIYELENKEGSTQTLTFFRDLPEDRSTHHNGALCQEVLRALLDRMHELLRQKPCQESVEIIQHLRAAFVLFESTPEELPTDERGHVLNFVE